MADAILIETYAACLRDKAASGVRFAFVTHNKSDFSSEDGTHRAPHADFANLFSRVKSLYFINLPEALRRIEPSLELCQLTQCATYRHTSESAWRTVRSPCGSRSGRTRMSAC